METGNQYTIKYHYGGELVREGEEKYINGALVDYFVDPDKICYWDLLVNMKELGYDIEKDVSLLYIDNGAVFRNVCDDKDFVGLAD